MPIPFWKRGSLRLHCVIRGLPLANQYKVELACLVSSTWLNNLSEQLQLLHGLSYSDLDVPYQDSGTHSNKMSSRKAETNHEVRFLDTIAAALTTGNPGDVFAAASDKGKRMELVLAKMGLPLSRT